MRSDSFLSLAHIKFHLLKSDCYRKTAISYHLCQTIQTHKTCKSMVKIWIIIECTDLFSEICFPDILSCGISWF